MFSHYLKTAAGICPIGFLGLLGLTLPGSLRADTIYTYQGAQYNVSSGCAGSYCSGGPYGLVATFAVAAGTPLTSLNNVDITADVTSFSFSDGSGFVITQADNTFSDQFIISTDANENITIWTLNVCTTPPYFAPGSSAGGACMDTYWIPSYPQVLDRTSWTDGSEDGQCFAYGQGVVQSSNCLGNFVTTLPGSTTPEPSNLVLIGAGLLGLLAYREKIAKAPMATLLLCAMAASTATMHAGITYTYTGDPLSADPPNTFAPFTTSDSVTGSFTLASALGASLPLTDITSSVIAFSFSDVLETFNSSTTLTNEVFEAATDPTGAIDEWEVYLVSGPGFGILSCSEANTATCLGPGWGIGEGDETFYSPGLGLAESPDNGTWASNATPEPSSAGLLFVGLFLIYSARTLWTNCTAIDPSPTAAATRFMLPDRTSPTAKTPGRLVSNK
jgi:hypothetical protein